MDRRAYLAAALLTAGLWSAAPPATAQTLQRLTVDSFSLSTDNATPQIEQPFHLVVVLRVRQRLVRVDNLNLPLLAQLELLGDERETRSGPRGTEYRETITVVAHQPGSVAIAPATLQAVDARDGKPKQWYTNGLRLHVTGPPLIVTGMAALRGALWAVLRVLLWVGGALLIVGLIVIVVCRRPRRAPVAVAPSVVTAPPPPVVERSPRQQIDDALTVLRAEHTRSAAIRVRAAVWRTLGASEGETLGDVLRRPQAADPVLRALLVALERSAFTYDDDLNAAIDDACLSLERYAESLP